VFSVVLRVHNCNFLHILEITDDDDDDDDVVTSLFPVFDEFDLVKVGHSPHPSPVKLHLH